MTEQPARAADVRLIVDSREVVLPGRHAQALRLFGSGRLVKQIGHELGIAEITVKTYLRAGRDALGASDNREAAAILLRHEDAGYTGGIYTTAWLEAGEPNDKPMAKPQEAVDTQGTGNALEMLQDGRVSFRHEAPRDIPGRSWRRHFRRPEGQRTNDLTPVERIESSLILTFALAACGALIIIAVVLITAFLRNAGTGAV